MIIVDSHHQVLPHWARLRASLKEAPLLLTLDHHTDTSAPFRNRLKNLTLQEQQDLRKQWLSEIDYTNPLSVEKAVEKLGHDEHIVTALQTDILKSAFVIAQNAYDTPIEVYDDHRILCQSVDSLDAVLESAFLEEKVKNFRALLETRQQPFIERCPYILDIDLDYLNTYKALEPQDSSLLKRLVKNAALVTIATEAEHVGLCAKDKGLESEWILQTLLKLLVE